MGLGVINNMMVKRNSIDYGYLLLKTTSLSATWSVEYFRFIIAETGIYTIVDLVTGSVIKTGNFDSSNDSINADLSGTSGYTALYIQADNENIDYINVISRNLYYLDVTQNTALISLYAYSNQLTNLDVTQNTALIRLYAHNNQLTSLDVTQNTALTYLYVYSNQLTNLDVTKNTALTYLYVYSNQLTSLDVTQNTALIRLYAYNNQLTSLDVTQNTALITLFVSSNQLTSLDVTQNTALTYLYAYNNQLTSLDLRGLNLNNFTIFKVTLNPNLVVYVDDLSTIPQLILDGVDATATFSL